MSDMVVIYLRFGGRALPTSPAQNKPPKKDGTGKCYGKTRNGGRANEIRWFLTKVGSRVTNQGKDAKIRFSDLR